MVHTITLTKLPDETSDDFEYEIGGEHDQSCAVSKRCPRARCQAMNPDNDPGPERRRHGVDHWHLDGEWFIEDPTGCGLDHVFESTSEAEYFDGRELGVYEPSLTWDDEWYIEELWPVEDGGE
ncbi:hypothetical protein [Mycetocola saprophilus]|uniref:hypothetical protein n=1 Tax=Mycetocola saprophilus TaxID=76636 RepID=UPI0004BEE577|nr:hypothetical protein [Mycetocola saprophilus]